MSKQIPTIAIFAAHFPPCPGGIAKFMGITANSLAEQGAKVVIVTSDFNNPVPSHENISLIKLPIHETWLGSKRYPIVKRNGHYRELMKELRDHKVERVITLTRFHSTTMVAARFARKNNLPLYLLECGANPLTLNNKLLDIGLRAVEKILTRTVRRDVHRWGAMSTAGNEFLRKQYSIDGTFVWPCSIEVPEKVTKTTKNNELTITYSGRIENLKGEEELAHAFTKLAKGYPNIQLNFLGDGTYLPTLKKKYTNRNVKYWGNVSPDVVSRVNLATDIFVCATRFPDGAVPNSLLEAGIAKCAGITSPNGGFNDLMVHEHNGLVTKPDISNMEECLERLIVDKSLRNKLATNLFTDIKSKYQSSSVAKVIIRDLQQ